MSLGPSESVAYKLTLEVFLCQAKGLGLLKNGRLPGLALSESEESQIVVRLACKFCYLLQEDNLTHSGSPQISLISSSLMVAIGPGHAEVSQALNGQTEAVASWLISSNFNARDGGKWEGRIWYMGLEVIWGVPKSKESQFMGLALLSSSCDANA